jgi:beta-galactosidase
VQDRLGLLRCLEPGGGAQGFAPDSNHPGVQRYMRAKIAGMIRAFRSHPAVAHYIIQNETTLDPESPELASLFALMQEEDPSRTIVGNDGFTMRAPQAWTEPYQPAIHKSHGKATIDGGAGGWWVDHTGHFSDVWQDTYYNSPEDFYYRTPVRGEITEWGEMKGAASIDNHVSVLAQIRKYGGHSYDKLDHEEQLAAYNHFLDQGGFRKDFPDVQQLFRSIGARAYESWGQFLENVRICDENDMCAVSGWESTAMENHSGLVDNFRDLKSDPKPIRDALLPVRPIAKQRNIVVRVGERAKIDPWFLNDTNEPVTGELSLSISSPLGAHTEIAKYPVPAFKKDQFSWLLGPPVDTPVLNTAGFWTTTFALNSNPANAHHVALLAVESISPKLRPIRVGITRLSPQLEELLRRIPKLTIVPFSPNGHYDVLIGSGGSADASKDLATDPEGAYKPGPGPLPEFTLPDEAIAQVKAGTPLLAITPTDGQSIGVAKQLASAGTFAFQGMVGASRASWMGSWYFPRKHPLYEGMPTQQAMGIHYQVKGGGSNGWMVSGNGVEMICGYGRDHDRNLGAGTFVARVAHTPVVMHRIVDMHPVLLERFLTNALAFLTNPVHTSEHATKM